MPENIIYPRVQARVKFYSRERGYGFLKRPNQKMDVYLDSRDLDEVGLSFVRPGDLLEFDLIPVKNKGGRAKKIKMIERVKND